MWHPRAVVLVAVVLCAGIVSARTEYTLGGPEGNPWQAALSTEGAGDFVTFDEEGGVLRRVAVATVPHGASGDTLVQFEASGFLNSIQPLFIEPEANLALSEADSPEIKIPLPITSGQALTTDGCSALDDQIRAVKRQFDGDVTTAHFRRFTAGNSIFSGGGALVAGITGEGWKNAVVLDFGAAVPVNRIRFYPRLGRQDDQLLIQDLRTPQPSPDTFGESSFADNFVEGFEIRVADNTVRFAGSPCDRPGIVRGLRWVRTQDPLLEVLEAKPENLDRVVDLRFATRSVRWMTFKTFPLRDWEVAEFEVYGEGFVEKTSYRTQIMDFSQAVNWGKIRWSGEAPEGTRVEIRTRSGSTPDPNLYFAENTNGDLRQITFDAYEDIDPSGRLDPRPDADNWSFWSPPYSFESGRRDESLPAEAWDDGTPVQSPGPSRYIQLEVLMFSTFTRAPRIDQLQIQLAEVPLAREVVGEIWPIEVETFVSTPFTYIVRPTFDEQHLGFDRLEILTHSSVDGISGLVVDGEQLDLDQFPPQILSDRVILSFPELRGQADSFKRIEVSFEVPVLRYGSEFSGWVFNTSDPDRIRQQVRAGNSTFQFSGNVLSVATPLQGNLLVDLEPSSPAITPNGDGVNDELVLTYKLRQLTLARRVRLQVYDLAGRRVRDLAPEAVASGIFEQRWDGRGDDGLLVPPGTYVYSVTLDAEREERRVGVLSVVY